MLFHIFGCLSAILSASGVCWTKAAFDSSNTHTDTHSLTVKGSNAAKLKLLSCSQNPILVSASIFGGCGGGGLLQGLYWQGCICLVHQKSAEVMSTDHTHGQANSESPSFERLSPAAFLLKLLACIDLFFPPCRCSSSQAVHIVLRHNKQENNSKEGEKMRTSWRSTGLSFEALGAWIQSIVSTQGCTSEQQGEDKVFVVLVWRVEPRCHWLGCKGFIFQIGKLNYEPKKSDLLVKRAAVTVVELPRLSRFDGLRLKVA